MGFSARLFEVVLYPDNEFYCEIPSIIDKYAVKDYAYIEHNKDVKADGTPLKPHIHLILRMTNTYISSYVAGWFGVLPNNIERVKGRFADALKYLTHENAPTKYQYSVDDVKSNFDWVKEKDKSVDTKIDFYVTQIVNGVIREYNYFDYISPTDYVKYKRKIDDSFAYRKDKIKGAERDMECIFITGLSGVGKTTYAKEIANKRGYSVFVSSGGNDILDDYKGQDCIILDDLRPSCLGLSDLLKMLDNHTASTVRSRYKNKVIECRVIIITTILDIDTFFNNVFENDNEPCVQLKRRCRVMIRMDSKAMRYHHWDDSKRKYVKGKLFKNRITERYGLDALTDAHMTHFYNSVGLTDDDIIDEQGEEYDLSDLPESFF